jgi:DNA-binding PadR family transcriptional regulator
VSIPYVLLGLLSRGPRHGYDLKREHDARFPQAKPLPPGQVYATLGRLLRDDLVNRMGASQATGRTGGPTPSPLRARSAYRHGSRNWSHQRPTS